MVQLVPLGCIILLYLGWPPQYVGANPMIDPTEALNFALQLVDKAKQIKKLSDEQPTNNNQSSVVVSKMFEKLDSISEDIQGFYEDIFMKISDDLRNKLTSRSSGLFKQINNVQRLYKDFLGYVKDFGKVPKPTLEKFYNKVTSNSSAQSSTNMKKIHEVLTNNYSKRENVFNVLADEKNPELMCIRGQSPQQIIVDFYRIVVLTDIESLVIKLFAFDQKELYENRTYNFEKAAEIQDFDKRIGNTLTFIEELPALHKASRVVWKCDPDQQQKGVTYSKLEEVFQSYINYEDDFEPGLISGLFPKCSKKCFFFFDNAQRCKSPFCKRQSKNKRCNGRLRNCGSTSNDVTLCLAPEDSDRRYQWMVAGARPYGDFKRGCDRTENVKSESSRLIYTCDYCLCTCESDDKKINRYFSLQSSVADTTNNYVVTGIRFKLVENVFVIQLQEGVLGPNGTIDSNTVHWQPIRDVNKQMILNGTADVYKVDWEHKTVYLDDVEPKQKNSSNMVVTGLRFKKYEDALQLGIQTTEFDYSTGKLKNSSIWHFNAPDRSYGLTAKTWSNEWNNPLKSKMHLEDSESGDYFAFSVSSLDKDLGQYTVPFIDIQEVVSNPPMPLSGAGTLHKGAKESAGFLALKIIQYDFSRHL